jgi:uncharacterized membrane protein
MKKNDFIQRLDHPLIEQAIARAEAASSGEIRVVVMHRPASDPVADAQAAFRRLSMEKTRARNSVLLFVAPESQTFAIIGDEAVHAKCGQPFWDELAAVLQSAFARGEFTAGIVTGIDRAGALLAAHFPSRSDDIDELPNTVSEQ